jgi:hypothetical protein
MLGPGQGSSELREAIANRTHGPGCPRTVQAFFFGGLAGGKEHVASVIGSGDAVLLANQTFRLGPIQRDGGDFVTQRAVAWYFENVTRVAKKGKRTVTVRAGRRACSALGAVVSARLCIGVTARRVLLETIARAARIPTTIPAATAVTFHQRIARQRSRTIEPRSPVRRAYRSLGTRGASSASTCSVGLWSDEA